MENDNVKFKIIFKKVNNFCRNFIKSIKKKKFTTKQILLIGFFILFLLAATDWFIGNGGFDVFKNFKFGGNKKFNSREFNIHDDQASLSPANLENLTLGPKFKGINKLTGIFKDSATVKPEDDLQEIIAGVGDNGIIYLESGVYNLNLFINKRLRIIGKGEETILKADNKKNAIIKVRDGGLGLENVVLADSYIGLDAGNSELFISDVKFSNVSTTALYAKNSQVEFKYSIIVDSGSAIKVVNSRGSIENSIISDNNKIGIRLIASDFTIEYNKITNNSSYGVFVDEDSSAEIRYNYIEDNEGYNVRIQETRDIYK